MIGTLWPLLAGFTIWLSGFAMLYAIQALGCLWFWPEPWHRTLLIAMAIGIIVALVILLAWQNRNRRSPLQALDTAGLALTALAIAASAITFAPALFSSICR